MVDGYATNQYPDFNIKSGSRPMADKVRIAERNGKTYPMPESSQSDVDIIKSVIDGNKEDYGNLVGRYQQKIFSYLYRFLHENHQAAEEVAQSVFIKVYENLRRVDQSRPLQPWIYRIAHNEAANYLRSLSRKKESSLSDSEWNKLGDTDPEPESDMDENLLLTRRAMGLIKAKYREVIVLYYYEERSYEEIATILNTSTNTVGTLLRRARQQLQKMIEKMNKGELFNQLRSSEKP